MSNTEIAAINSASTRCRDFYRGIVAITSSLIIYTLYIISMFSSITRYITFANFQYGFLSIIFYLMLVIIIVSELVSRESSLSEYLSSTAIALAIIYAFFSSFNELSRLTPGYFIVIPPSIVLIECSIPRNCDGFSTISISIPLTIAFALLIYGIYTVYRCRKTTVFSKQS